MVKAVSKVDEGRGDLGFEDRRVVDRLKGAGTQRAGDARAGPGVKGRRLEAADRDALGTEGDHADDLGVIEADLDRLLQASSARLPGPRGRWSCCGLATLGSCSRQRSCSGGRPA